MVKEVPAYEADDGSIHSTKLAALEHDVIEALKDTTLFNHASALAIAKAAIRVSEILKPLAAEQLEQQKVL